MWVVKLQVMVIVMVLLLVVVLILGGLLVSLYLGEVRHGYQPKRTDQSPTKPPPNPPNMGSGGI